MIILGAGGHAKVLIDILRLRSVEMFGLTDAEPSKRGQSVMGVPVIGGDEVVARYSSTTTHLVNGLGSVCGDHRRHVLFERFKGEGYTFANVIHPSAIIATDTALSEGVQILAGAVVQSGCTIGKNCIINTGAVVEHDCQIGDHAHVAPSATLSGGVHVGENAHIGAGSTVIQQIRIGRNSLVGAGAVVISDVKEGVTVAGVPAREIRS